MHNKRMKTHSPQSGSTKIFKCLPSLWVWR